MGGSLTEAGHSPLLLGGIAASFIGLSVLMLRALDQQEKLKTRLSRAINPMLHTDIEIAGRAPGGRSAVDLIAKIGSTLARSGLLPAATRTEFELTLAQAGWRGGRGLGLFVGCKVLGSVILPLVVWFSLAHKIAPMSHWAITGVAFVAGLLGPDFVLRQMRAAHLKRVERGLPDALDMMVICAQAGLALENAIERVALEFAAANKAVSDELAFCAGELRIGTDRRQALTSLGERTGLDTMKRFASTLIQTMQFGTPLTHALRVLASEMRTDMLTKYEEKAARLPVMLTMPMILFILPTIFIVVGGPAGVRVSRMFSAK